MFTLQAMMLVVLGALVASLAVILIAPADSKSIVAPLLIQATDFRIAFFVTGSLLPIVLITRLTAIWRLDSAATVPIVERMVIKGLRRAWSSAASIAAARLFELSVARRASS